MCYQPPGFAQQGLSSILGAGRKKSVPAKNSGVCLREEEGEQVAATKWQSNAEAAVPVWEVTGAPCQLPQRLLFLPRCRPHGGVRPVEMVEEASGSPGSSGNPLPSLLQLEKIGKRSKWRLLRYSPSMSFGNVCSLGLGCWSWLQLRLLCKQDAALGAVLRGSARLCDRCSLPQPHF